MDVFFTLVARPTILAIKGQACYHCQQSKIELQRPLQRCSGCCRIYYCNSKCQKADWQGHKDLCRALRRIEDKDPMSLRMPLVFADIHRHMLGFIDAFETTLNTCLDQVGQVEISALKEELGRPLTKEENHIVSGEPRCLACGRSDRIFRIETKAMNEVPQASVLKPCPRCHLSFYCCKSHWEAVKHRHRSEVSPGRYDLPQCEVNQLVMEDIKFDQYMRRLNFSNGEFRWTPLRRFDAWKSLRGLDWDEFKPVIYQDFGRFAQMQVMMGAIVRGVTEALAMPMTILWALETLNDDDEWTRKETLTIHFMGTTRKELLNTSVFQEMLSRLPQVKNVQIVLCGPLIADARPKGVSPTERYTLTMSHPFEQKIVYHFHPVDYHDYITSQGDKFTKPDLAVAFDAGITEPEVIDSWKTTLSFLTNLQIPSVFTALVLDDAHSEAKLLREAGAVLHPKLGPRRNPWGSLIARIDPNRVTGFYSSYEWLAGGFR